MCSELSYLSPKYLKYSLYNLFSSNRFHMSTIGQTAMTNNREQLIIFVRIHTINAQYKLQSYNHLNCKCKPFIWVHIYKLYSEFNLKTHNLLYFINKTNFLLIFKYWKKMPKVGGNYTFLFWESPTLKKYN